MIIYDFKNINSIPKIIKNYLGKSEDLKDFFCKYPSYENILEQAKNKIKNYNNREILFSEISNQLSRFDLSEKQKNNLNKLKQKNTVTITTGHQLNLLTGSIFFHYKILQTIKLCDTLNNLQKEINFVPIFWLASEDHDFKEINHFYFKDKKYELEGMNSISVGKKEINNIEKVFQDFFKDIKEYSNSKNLIDLIKKCYYESGNLSFATQKIVHELFKKYGLLFIDADSKELKKLMIPYFKDELLNGTSFKLINKTCEILKSNYKIQVNPREINLFYQHEKSRSRIVKKNKTYFALINENENQEFSEQEILEILEKNPDKISPNALLRPFYQEVILPNVAYIGGNAEIAYWLELKSYFEYNKVDFPVLIPRNSFFIINSKQKKVLEKYQINFIDLLNNKEYTVNKLVSDKSTINIDFNKYKNIVENIYSEMIYESKKTDKTLENLLLVQQKKQINSFEKTKKRLLKAEKRNQKILVDKINNIHNQLLCFNTWQERSLNFSQIHLLNPDFNDFIYKEIEDLIPKLKIITSEYI